MSYCTAIETDDKTLHHVVKRNKKVVVKQKVECNFSFLQCVCMYE